MRVAYYAPVDVSIESGVCKKILSQVTTWLANGVDARIFAYSTSQDLWQGFPSHLITVVARGGFANRIQRVARLVQLIIDWKPDIVYMRQGFYYPPLEYLMRKIPTVLEINTNDLAEAKLYLSPVKYIYYKLTRDRLLRCAAGLVCITDELAQLFSHFNLPVAVIPNGINLKDYTQLPPPKNPSPVLIFIGHAWEKAKSPLKSASYWYFGIEKMLQIANAFSGWSLVIVGFNIPEPALPNVRIYGHLSRSEYEALMANADIAIGPLGLYMKSMNEACPLKVREYLAYGLPVIIGYRDSDFPNGAPFLLELPNTPDNVEKNLVRINEFVHHWKGQRVPRSEILHLDITHKESQRLAFMHSLI